MLDIKIETMFMNLEMFLNDKNKLNQIEKIKNDLIKNDRRADIFFLMYRCLTHEKFKL
jgi:hypothetical protein